MMALTYSVRKAFLSMPNPLLTVHRSFKNLAYVGTCLIMSSRGMLTFTCLSTSRMPACLDILFLPLGTWGNGGGMLFFNESSLINMCTDSTSYSSIVSSASLGVGWSTCLPFLKVMIAFTSSILGAGLLAEPISWTPLGLGSVWEGNLPCSCT